jgi:hypothetical protein
MEALQIKPDDSIEMIELKLKLQKDWQKNKLQECKEFLKVAEPLNIKIKEYFAEKKAGE